MPRGWRRYQQDAAAFFIKQGLSAKIEHTVDGARGRHVIDVFVEGQIHGLPFKWIVECKAWRTNVPKEKVMALASIVQDVGADRGLLLSEKGFQSGALRVSQKSNITLSSLADLSAATAETLLDAAIGSLYWRCQKAYTRLWAIKKDKYDHMYFPPMIKPATNCFMLMRLLESALKDEYPFTYVDGDGEKTVGSVDELLTLAVPIIEKAEQWQESELSS